MSANRKAYRSRSGHRRGYTQGFGDANEIVMHEVDRDRMTFRGPALVEDPGSTPGHRPRGSAEVMASGSIVVTLG